MRLLPALLLTLLVVLCSSKSSADVVLPDDGQPMESCENLPRPENAALPNAPIESDWFEIYQAADGVYALVEAWQFQETISYLILGTERALLFDTGLGLVPLRPVVEALTDLPVEVLNSHTHYDHVGGNAEFDTVLAVDTTYTRANMAGFPHAELASEVVPNAFCRGAPAAADLENFHTRAWQASRTVTDGEVLDLGGRKLEILQVPGHTPDAVALVDRENGLMWTGDTYYDGGLWLFVPETDLDAYQKSIDRLVSIASEVTYLLPAHNTARADPGQLRQVSKAIVKIRSGTETGVPESGQRLIFKVDGITVLTAQPVLDGQQGDLSLGGSGLTTWP